MPQALFSVGADAKMIATGQGTNPVVLATFKGLGVVSSYDKPKLRIVFYECGYVGALRRDLSSTQTMENVLIRIKRLAVACAASNLLRRRLLWCNVVFLIQGEEEAGSGFEGVIREYKESTGEIDALLVSVLGWIGEDTPCITYGLRGVVHGTVDVFNSMRDLHSGVESGSVG